MEQKRFITAMVLSAGVLFLWQYFVAPPPETDQPQDGQEAAQTAEEEPAQQAPGDGQQAPDDGQQASDDGQQAPDDGQQAAAVQAEEETADDEREPAPTVAPMDDVSVETHVMQSEKLKVTLTNANGGRVTGVELLKPEQYVKRGDLLQEFPQDSPNYPFGLQFVDNNITVPDDVAWEIVEDQTERAPDGTYQKVTYRFVDPEGKFELQKSFALADDKPYVVDMDVRLTNLLEKARLIDTMALDNYGYKDPNEETSMLNFRPNETEGVCKLAEDTERESIQSIEETLQYDNQHVLWGAIDTRYFMLAAVPDGGAESCIIEPKGDYIRTRLVYDDFSIMPGQTQEVSHELFMGPKNLDVLGEVGHSLEASVDYGMFSFIAQPLRWGLNHIQDWVVNWGLAIILLTIIIKVLTWPINMKAYTSMERMKEIQPRLQEVREKYENDKQRMTEETMKLFKENDVSPFGGCLPMLLQMPILYGLYIMIYYSVELYHADFALWYDNLAAPDEYFVLPIIMGVVMLIQQNMMSQATAQSQPGAKMMTKIMPVMFTAFMLFLPSGLVLYYCINLLIGIGQQLYVRKIKFAE